MLWAHFKCFLDLHMLARLYMTFKIPLTTVELDAYTCHGDIYMVDEFSIYRLVDLLSIAASIS